MSDIAAGSAGSARRWGPDWLSGWLMGLATGAGLAGALSLSVALLAWNNHEPEQVEIGAHRSVAPVPALGADAAPTTQSGRAETVDTKPTNKPLEPAPAGNRALAVSIDGSSETSRQPTTERSPGPPALTAATDRVLPGDSDPFKLSPPPVSMPAPFVLPQNPWFALEDLAIGESESCDGTQAVCAANRSLNTALTWAKSPAEAAEQARRDGKLVFLIHVSGNFEDPGFT
jgi:hypothetical protein